MDLQGLGAVAAELMETLSEDEEQEGELKLGEVMVLAEVKGKDEDGEEWTSIRWRCSDPRAWIQYGMLHAALTGERLVD